MESNALELRPLVDEEDARPGLSRDRYPCDRPVTYWLYEEAHTVLPDPKEEFEFWSRHIWDGFNSAVRELVKLPQRGRRWIDPTGEPRVESKEETRNRVRERIATRTGVLDGFVLGLSYDLAVLHANYTLDRGFRAQAAVRMFDKEAEEDIEAIRQAWHTAANRLGLSAKKQERRSVDLDKPFREVRADFRVLVESHPPTAALADTSTHPATDSFSGDWLFVAASKAVPAAHGRIDLSLRILKDHLTREMITPEIAWKELRAIPSDDRYSDELRRRISNELAHLVQPPGDVEGPAMDALRNMLRSRADKPLREGMKIVIDRILAPREIKDYEAAKRHAQRVAARSPASAPDRPNPQPMQIELRRLKSSRAALDNLDGIILSALEADPHYRVQLPQWSSIKVVLDGLDYVTDLPKEFAFDENPTVLRLQIHAMRARVEDRINLLEDHPQHDAGESKPQLQENLRQSLPLARSFQQNQHLANL